MSQRTPKDVGRFHVWLAQNRPDLMPRSPGDPVRLLRGDLGRLVTAPSEDAMY